MVNKKKRYTIKQIEGNCNVVKIYIGIPVYGKL